METALYLPVKGFLEGLGFRVKGEICGCDVVALSDEAAALVVVCELKRSFNLELVLQGVDRASACDEVWLAAARRRGGREADKRFRALCRRLGFGLLAVDADGRVEAVLDPASPAPRRDAKRRSRLIEEHRRRRGDPAVGGGSRAPIMTAYRQRTLACAAALAGGPLRPRDLKDRAADAPQILLRNVYGWFERLERGVYGLTEEGRLALLRWPQTERDAEAA